MCFVKHYGNSDRPNCENSKTHISMALARCTDSRPNEPIRVLQKSQSEYSQHINIYCVGNKSDDKTTTDMARTPSA